MLWRQRLGAYWISAYIKYSFNLAKYEFQFLNVYYGLLKRNLRPIKNLLLRAAMNMKRFISAVILSLFAIVALGQQKNEGTTKAQNRPLKRDNFIIDLTYDHLDNAPNGVNFKFGYGHSFQFFYDHQFKAKVLSGAIGVGYSRARYFNNGYLTHKNIDGDDFSTFNPIRSDSSYKSNAYTTRYLDIPFEIRYRSKPNSKGHSWKASVGFRVGFRLGSYTTTKTSDGRYSDFIQPNLTRNRYGLTGRVGYGRVGLVGYYGLTRLFEPEKGHELIPFSVGISIAPF